MRFTLSVRSFHVPATPGTCAWPPSLPSVPTSRRARGSPRARAPFSSSTIGVHGRTDPQELTSNRLAVDLERHLLAQVPRGHDGQSTRATSVEGRARSPTSALKTRRWWPSPPTSLRHRSAPSCRRRPTTRDSSTMRRLMRSRAPGERVERFQHLRRGTIANAEARGEVAVG